jgi:suppressor of ftsI/bilirubin oxidase
MLLVEDAAEDELRRALGLEFGINEMPLLFQDKQLDAKNQFKYSIGEDDWIGNRVLVNSTPEPRWTAQRCLTRLRLLNASNARPYRIAFLVGERLLPYWIIGTDGGWLEGPLKVNESYLAPAQRLDVLIDLSELDAGTRVRVVSLAFDAMENDGAPMTEAHLEHPGAPPIGQQIDLMAIDLEGPARRRPALPSSLSRIVRARDGKPDRVFRIHIDNGRWLINGRNHHDDMERARFEVRRGAREIWELRNDTQSMPHPMHIHAFRFQVLAREHSPQHIARLALGPSGLTPQDLGWLDTVLIWPGERVRIALDFAQPFQGPQMYMFHCHNLEHEDQGLMLNFRVIDV